MNIQIKGSCVTREALNYWNVVFPDKENISVDYYMFQKPIAAVASNPIKMEQDLVERIKIEMVNGKGMRDFAIKQFPMSLHKVIVKPNVKHEYYIIDLIDERMSLIEYGDSLIEYREEIESILKPIIRRNNTYNVFVKYINIFIEKLKMYYPEDRIILHKAYAVYTAEVNGNERLLTETLADDNQRYNQYTLREAIKRNELLALMYTYIERNYPSITVIELEYGKYRSPINHRYGRGYYHYEDDYYIDFVKRLNAIFEASTDYEELNNIKKRNRYNLTMSLNNIKSIDSKVEMLNDIKKRVLDEIECLQSEISDFSNKDNIIEYKNENSENIVDVTFNNRKVQTQTIYNNEDNSLVINEFYLNGIINSMKFYKNNELRVENIFSEKGYLKTHKEYKNGGMNKEINYGNYCKIGNLETITEYNSDGDKVYFGMNYGNGYKRSRTYYLQNNVYNYTEVYDSEEILIEKRFYNDDRTRKKDEVFNGGMMVKSIEYFKDEKIKNIKLYDINGNLIEESSRKSSIEIFEKKIF